MLVKDYYTIDKITDTEECRQYHITLNADCPVYEGHFPGSPVSPGVCNIQMIKECAEDITGKKLFMNNLQLCRLTTLITPITHPQVVVNISVAGGEGCYKIKGSIGQGEETLLDLKAEMTEK